MGFNIGDAGGVKDLIEQVGAEPRAMMQRIGEGKTSRQDACDGQSEPAFGASSSLSPKLGPWRAACELAQHASYGYRLRRSEAASLIPLWE